MAFTRGSVFISRMSWILPCSEKWPKQEILVVFHPDSVEISYDVTMGCSMVIAPNVFVREVAELACILVDEGLVRV